MPTCPRLFPITNVRLITKDFSSRYLKKHAAGKEEHTTSGVTPGTNRRSWKVDTGGIENKKNRCSAEEE